MGLREEFQKIPDNAFSNAIKEDAMRVFPKDLDPKEEDHSVANKALASDFPSVIDFCNFLRNEYGDATNLSEEQRRLISYGAYLFGLAIRSVANKQALGEFEA